MCSCHHTGVLLSKFDDHANPGFIERLGKYQNAQNIRRPARWRKTGAASHALRLPDAFGSDVLHALSWQTGQNHLC